MMLTKSQNNDIAKIGVGQWLLASGLGWIVGNWITNLVTSSLVSIAPSSVNPQSFSGLLTSDTSLALIGGIFLGLCVGAFQWAVVKRYADLSGFWLVTNILAWSFAYILSSWIEAAIFLIPSVSLVAEGVPALVRTASTGLCGGLSLGILQWSLVKNGLSKPITWFWISTTSWSLPFMIYTAFVYFAFLFPRNHAVNYYQSAQYRSLANSLNLIYILFHESIGLMSGIITFLMLSHKHKKYAKYKLTESQNSA